MSRNPSGDKAWVEHWARVGPELERIRRDELRRFRYDENIEIIDSLLEAGLRHAQPRPTSGLVELQRILHGKRYPGQEPGRSGEFPGAEP